jgi:hypothetical protein
MPHSSISFQGVAHQSSQANHNDQYQSQGQSQNGPHQSYEQYSGLTSAAYKPAVGVEGRAEGVPVDQFQNLEHQSAQGHDAAHHIMNAFKHDSASTQYHQQQSGKSTLHQQPHQNIYAHGYDSQQGTQQPHLEHDHEAAQKAMAGFEQEEQHQGDPTTNDAERGQQSDPLDEFEQEALFELPYTQQPSDGQQPSSYQQETQNSADGSYSQGHAEQKSAHQFQDDDVQQQQEGQSNQDPYSYYQQQQQGQSDQDHYQQSTLKQYDQEAEQEQQYHEQHQQQDETDQDHYI